MALLKTGFSAAKTGFSSLRYLDERITPLARRGMRTFGNVAVTSGQMAWKGGGSTLARGAGKLAMSPVGLGLGMGALSGALTYDKSKHDFARHMGTEIGAALVDDRMTTMAFRMNPVLGVLTVGGVILDVSPGSLIRDSLQRMGENIDRKRFGSNPIQQNQRTLSATRAQMSMLGQGGGHSMLGSEAAMMHDYNR